MTTQRELWAGIFVRKKVERKIKERAAQLTAGISAEDFEYAAQNNLNIIASILKPEEQKSRRKSIAPAKDIIDQLTVDDFLRLFEEVSPQHASVLRRHRQWFARQIEMGKQDLFS